MSVDPKGHCSDKHFEGLSFLGWFEEGKPTGPCWRFLVGGTYIYGVVDNRGEFTGSNDIAFNKRNNACQAQLQRNGSQFE